MLHSISLKSITACAVMLFFSLQLPAQRLSFWQSDSAYNARRANGLAIAGVGAWSGSMAVLYTAWYKGYDQTGFHGFNDVDEWQQMDKLGHLGSAYYLGVWSAAAVRWAGVDRKKAAWWGAAAGTAFQTGIELQDAFSARWGFSTGDVVANTAGSLLFLSQELGWQEQRIRVKFSYHESGLAYRRPDLLGRDAQERLLKDYNGQTYWLSASLRCFSPEASRIPSWLALAVGYSADGMIGARSNKLPDGTLSLPEDQRVRRFFLSPDIDLTRLPVKGAFWKGLTQVFGFVKLPFPAVEYRSTKNWYLHPLYF